MRRRLLAALVLGTTLAIAGSARAAPSEAQQRFEEGRALLKEGHPAEAIPKFIASIASEPTVAGLLNLADCYEKVGKLASAHTRFRQAQELAKDKDAVRSEEARKRAEILEPRLSTITLLPPAQSAGVRVWVDGVEVPVAEWGKPRPYDVGPHEVIAQDQAGARRKSSVVIAGEAARLTAPIEVAAPPRPVGPPPPPPKDEESSSLRAVGLVVGGVGIAGLVTGTVTGIVALGASSDLKSACATYPQCPANQRGELTDLDDKARTFATVSTLSVVAGAVLVATGAVLYFVSPPSRSRVQGATPGSLTAW